MHSQDAGASTEGRFSARPEAAKAAATSAGCRPGIGSPARR
ncbi:hypothetical protein [Amycolatopsis sp. MtRt-6]|nr:hypothetical protein [Amycolatopsis sp. MtRt-6]